MNESQKKEAWADFIIETLAKSDPIEDTGDDPYGFPTSYYCLWCDAGSVSEGDKNETRSAIEADHRSDCVWKQANAFVERYYDFSPEYEAEKLFWSTQLGLEDS